jgi:hypothetical protein
MGSAAILSSIRLDNPLLGLLSETAICVPNKAQSICTFYLPNAAVRQLISPIGTCLELGLKHRIK